MPDQKTLLSESVKRLKEVQERTKALAKSLREAQERADREKASQAQNQ